MKYFIKNLTTLFILIFLAYGYIAMFEYGKEKGYKKGFEDGKNWTPLSMIKADSLINANKYQPYLQGFKYYKMLDRAGSERLK